MLDSPNGDGASKKISENAGSAIGEQKTAYPFGFNAGHDLPRRAHESVSHEMTGDKGSVTRQTELDRSLSTC